MHILGDYGINVIVDVRSVPFSRHTPHFNRKAIQHCLAKKKIRYLFMGDEFGARRQEPDAYVSDRVSFEKVFQLSAFKSGVQRLQNGFSKNYKIALMCTEKDPADCHRTIMVTRYLSEKLGWTIEHIHFDGSVEMNDAFETRLQKISGCEEDLFTNDKKSLIEDAYGKIEHRIAYKQETTCLPN